MLTRLGISIPDTIDGFKQRVIADPTSPEYLFSTATSEMLTEVSEAVSEAISDAVDAANVLENEDQDPAVLVSKFSSDGAKGLGSVFSYATSKWALCCVAMACYLLFVLYQCREITNIHFWSRLSSLTAHISLQPHEGDYI